MLTCLLDWHLRKMRRGLPDLPEVRRYVRLCWLDGFTNEGLIGQARMKHARAECMAAVTAHLKRQAVVSVIEAILDDL